MDLKIAACLTPRPAPGVGERQGTAQAANGRSKMLGARVPPALHGEWQVQVSRPQDRSPSLITLDAVPALVHPPRDENVWVNSTLGLAQKARP
ncbi:hypothetical protein [Deinococcus humi]|uniref:Uncharacterized protein n=1 Tax=Deinococcus humi TaxID=662880 RepID=A0A7W8NDZ8_9DEIO|nr:hypothetical protein [Deinococcus humi]MBB5363764.1 hypothetical protein [Deinococcus humi]